jgi:hypothetical protein
MKHVTEGTSRADGTYTALKNKRAAEMRAAALAPTFRELMAAGFVSQQALADELNRRGISAALGGSWHRISVGKILRRLGLVTKGSINNGLANKKAGDARARALASSQILTLATPQAVAALSASGAKALIMPSHPSSMTSSARSKSRASPP